MSTAPTGAPVPPQLPQQQPPKRNDAVLWIIAIVAGGFVVLVLCALLLAGTFIRRVHVNDSGKQVEIETPAGSLRVNNEETHSTGLPVYPGAQPDKSQGAAVELSAAGAALGIAAEKYKTSDDLDQVSDWYQQKLGPSYKREEHGSGGHRERVNSDADVAFEYEKGDINRIVALRKKSNGVEIELLQIGKKEVQ